jgi:hypothetical protein
MPTPSPDSRRLLEQAAALGDVLAIKLYRTQLGGPVAIPCLPCLDHEAMLHGGVAPHLAVYLKTAAGDLHELVFVPSRARIEVDVVSTWAEHSAAAHRELLQRLNEEFPGYHVVVNTPSRWRGDRRVAEACRAHVSLRRVLTGDNLAAIKTDVDRLQTVGTLMEKNSRVASWGVRTVTGPLLAAAGVVTYQIVGGLAPRIGETGVTTLRSALVGLLGAVFLYYGLKAVQLTDMANRVWKRSAEYGLILAERRRLQPDPPPGPSGGLVRAADAPPPTP